MISATLLLSAALLSQSSPSLVGELGSSRFLQTNSIDALARDVDSGLMASCASGGNVAVWREASGELLAELDLGIMRGVGLGFLGSELLLVGDTQDHLHVLSVDVKQGALASVDPFERGWGDLADMGGGLELSPDGALLAQWKVTGAGGGVMLAQLGVDAQTDGARRSFELDGFRADDVAFSADGELMMVMATNAWKVIGRAGTRDQDSSRLHVFDVASGAEVARLISKDDLLHGVEFGPVGDAGERLVVGGGEGGLHLWDLEDGRELARFGDVGPVLQLGVSPDGARVFAEGKEGALEIWSMSLDAEPAGTLKRDGGPLLEPALFNGDFVLAGEGRRIRRWRVDGWRAEPDVVGHAGQLAALDARSGRAVSTGLDGSIFVWDLASGVGRPVTTEHAGLVLNSGLSPDGKRLVTCGQDATLRVLDLEEGANFGQQLESWAGRTAAGFTAAAYSPAGDVLAGVTADGVLWIRSATDGELLRTFEGLRGLQFQMAFSDDGRRLAVGSTGVRVWDTSTWELVCDEVALKSPVTALAFAPGGHELAVGLARKVVQVVDLASGTVRGTSEVLPSRVSSVAYFGEQIAATSVRLGGIRLLDRGLADVGFLASPAGRDVAVLTTVGETLLAGDQRGQIQIWK